MPALHVRVLVIGGHESRIGIDRVVGTWIGKAGRKALLCGKEARRGGCLVDQPEDHLRRVDGQQIGGARAVEVGVTDAVSAADYRFRDGFIREAHAGAEVGVIGIHQRPVVERPAPRGEHLAGRGVEIGKTIIGVPLRAAKFVAQSEIERELGGDAKIVLDVPKVHVLTQVGDEECRKLVLRTQTEDKIGQGVAAEVTGVRVTAVQRVDVRRKGPRMSGLSA